MFSLFKGIFLFSNIAVMFFSSPSFGMQSSKDDPEYSINLMWIYKDNSQSESSILPSKDQDAFFNKISGWAEKNKGEIINLWYDGNLVSQGAVDNTRQRLAEYASNHPDWGKVHLMNVQDIPAVRDNKDVFSPETPIYLRVDLLRQMAADHILQEKLKENKAYNFVYADLDMLPISKDEIFDEATRKKLNEYGAVMAYAKNKDQITYENAFQIIGNKHPNLLKAMKDVIINRYIGIVKKQLNDIEIEKSKQVNNNKKVIPLSERINSQAVYNDLYHMFSYYYHLENKGKIVSAKLKNVDKSIDSVEELTTQFISSNLKYVWSPYNGNGKKGPARVRVPVKWVNVPSSKFGTQVPKTRPLDLDNEIVAENYEEHLNKSLSSRTIDQPFNSDLLFLAIENEDDIPPKNANKEDITNKNVNKDDIPPENVNKDDIPDKSVNKDRIPDKSVNKDRIPDKSVNKDHISDKDDKEYSVIKIINALSPMELAQAFTCNSKNFHKIDIYNSLALVVSLGKKEILKSILDKIEKNPMALAIVANALSARSTDNDYNPYHVACDQETNAKITEIIQILCNKLSTFSKEIVTAINHRPTQVFKAPKSNDWVTDEHDSLCEFAKKNNMQEITELFEEIKKRNAILEKFNIPSRPRWRHFKFPFVMKRSSSSALY